VFGVEALIRWMHPEEGLLYPDRFIALAEEIGLIEEIGNWVLEQSCRKIVQWEQAGFGELNIAINISGRQLQDENFAEKIRRIILQTGCKPELIELEITEGYLIQRPEKTVSQFNELRKIGVQIAIDDFGTGYSSLSYLKQFPFSKLKIDYSFVRDILIDANDQAIARAIIALGKSLGLRVIAEGVEQLEQKQFLVAEGCDEAQGFYYARALPEDQLLEYIKKQSC
jgi:EAL domain-containing protein (putative c-di-GMP-specific phosphodiesterase class I)